MISTEDKLYLTLKYSIVEDIINDRLWLLNIGHSIPDRFFTSNMYSTIYGDYHILIRNYSGPVNINEFYITLLQYDNIRR